MIKKRMPETYFISPTFILGILFWGTLILFLSYEAGLIKSFLFDIKDIDIMGAVIYLFLLFGVYLLSKISGSGKTPCVIRDNRKDNRFVCKSIRFMCYFLALIQFTCAIIIFFYCAKTYGIYSTIKLGNSGYIANYDPFIINTHFLFTAWFSNVSIILAYSHSGMKNKLFFVIIGAISCFVFYIIYASRIILIEYFFIFACLFLRERRHYINKSNVFIILAFVIGTFLFIAYSSGTRDYYQYGFTKTDNMFLWGVSRPLDYFLSTFIFTSNIIGKGLGRFNLFELFPTLGRFFENGMSNDWKEIMMEIVGRTDYNNAGGLGTLLFSAGPFLGFVLYITFVFEAIKLWTKFVKGERSGLMFYPIVSYCLLELWRLFFFFQELNEFSMLFLFIFLIHLNGLSKKGSCTRKKAKLV